jgi:hypothetical protein
MADLHLHDTPNQDYIEILNSLAIAPYIKKSSILLMQRELKCFYGVGFTLAVLYAIAFGLQALNSFASPLFKVDLVLVFVCLVLAVRSAQRLFRSRSRRELI